MANPWHLHSPAHHRGPKLASPIVISDSDAPTHTCRCKSISAEVIDITGSDGLATRPRSPRKRKRSASDQNDSAATGTSEIGPRLKRTKTVITIDSSTSDDIAATAASVVGPQLTRTETATVDIDSAAIVDSAATVDIDGAAIVDSAATVDIDGAVIVDSAAILDIASEDNSAEDQSQTADSE